ncbi:MAG: 50S ribosomal protein L3 [Mycoplasmataceae bacterium]|nr:MAG: 50S ribosomal protein L3 [Mycoplasmataceae bacterium]
MALALMGKKIGMTQIFSPNGEFLLPVTVVLVTPNIVSSIKNEEKDGYKALQLAFEDCKEKSLNKSEIQHLAKNNISAKRYLREIRNMEGYSVGDIVDSSIFNEGDKVKVTGTSKGKGFAGVIKRYHFSRGPMGHGSGYHRGVGSMGSIAANRVFKGKKLPGRMGNEQRTVGNLTIYKILQDKNIILIKGCVPGPKDGLLIIKKNA